VITCSSTERRSGKLIPHSCQTGSGERGGSSSPEAIRRVAALVERCPR